MLEIVFSQYLQSLDEQLITRVKLVFECDFEIYWSLGPSDLGTLEPWNPWTLGLLDLLSSLLQHLLILPLTSSYLLLSLPPTLLLWYGLVRGGGEL